MLPHNANIHFTRITKRESWFSWPTVIFSLSSAGSGSPIGQFAVRTARAEFISADGRESFRLRRGFWGYRWMYEGADEQTFARMAYGFGKPSITFSDDSRYRMQLKRRWNIFRKPQPDEYEHLATFLREDTPVMAMQNNSAASYLPASSLYPWAARSARRLAICGSSAACCSCFSRPLQDARPPELLHLLSISAKSFYSTTS